MWPRVLEIMLACWLALSPLIFRYPTGESWLWWHDYMVATLIAVLAMLSFAPPLRRAHLFELLIAAWLIGYGWITSDGIHDAPRQNWMCLGLLILLTAIIPTDCDRQPVAWRRWYKERGIGGHTTADPYGRPEST